MSQSPRPRRPAWSTWAYDLARELCEQPGWEWLRGAKLPLIAAALGARLSPDWTVTDIVEHVKRQRSNRPWPTTITAPAAYLKSLLTNAAATPAENRRAKVTAQAAELRTAQATTRAEAKQRVATAVPSSANAAMTAWKQRRRGSAAAAGSELHEDQVYAEPWPEVRQPGSGSREG